MRPRSLEGRIVGLLQVVVLVAVAGFAISALLLTRHALQLRDRIEVVEAARQTARGFEEELAELGTPALAALGTFGRGTPPGLRIEILDAEGRVLGSSDPPKPSGAGGDVKAPDLVLNAASGHTVRVTRTDTREPEELEALALALGVSMLPLLLVTFLAGRFVVRRAMTPLSVMARRAETVRVGDDSGGLGDPIGLDEIDRLHASFSRLLERLGEALRAERRFTADASHELRTPLTALSGELELAAGRATPSTELAWGLERAAGQVRAMRELVDALLVLRRSDEVGSREWMEWVNLADVVRDVVGESRHELGESGHELSDRAGDVTVTAPDEVLVRGHAALLAAAARNLIDNAIKFTQPGERVRIDVSADATAGRIIVEDAGPGIPEAERERVFDSFYRGTEARTGPTGFGLGLPILRRVARVHGGDVTVGESTLGGARMELWVPLTPAADREPRQAGAAGVILEPVRP